MSNLSKLKLGQFLATITALFSTSVILATANKAEAIPLYPNDFGKNTQTVRLQMERNAPNGLPVTINITRSYGLKNGGLLNTWTGTPDDESLYNYITNGYAVNFQSRNGSYSISSPTVEIRDGTQLYTYASGFGRYQDWNIEKLGGQYGDTYLFHWRTDTDTKLCLDIRGFAPGQRLSNEIPGLSYCDGRNANQRIRVIKQGQNSPPTQPVTNISNIPNDCKFEGNCRGGRGTTHTGVDYMNPAGTQVNAICAGTVKYAFPSSTDIWNRFTIVEHKNCGGYGTLYGYYGHINPSVRVGDSVSKGQTIGSIADYPVNNSHLHFGLSTQILLNGWGYQSGIISQKGWIDPLAFGRNSGWR
jgi:murein DD-endopeptidase MepM/ murein hydrolase activator NlpD